MFKDILTWIDGETRSFAETYALALAGRFGAQVTGATLEIEPTLAPYEGAVPFDIIETIRRQAHDASAGEAERFRERLRKEGLNGDAVVIGGALYEAQEKFAALARHFDLTVLPQQQAAGDLRAQMIESALFGSGRPVLVAPYIWKPPARFERILVGWDRGAPAARALGDAMPLLRRASHVELVVVGDSGVDLPGFNITRHLARHDVKVELRRIPDDEDEIGSVLLSHAADSGADLLVMGGYGHSRFRETLFGGVTRSILDAMTLPTFMAR